MMKQLRNSNKSPLMIASTDGELKYSPNFIDSEAADKTFNQLNNQLDWQEETLFIMGKQITAPRLVCWYGDNNANYVYSGVEHIPLQWTPDLLALKEQVEIACNHEFNSVLGNLYRSGQDSMGWHADKEKQLGINPNIASLSFGAERLFKLRHCKNKQVIDMRLEHGSLLVMAGSLQHHWRHCLPKTREPVSSRINLTFRYIHKLNA